MPNQFAEIERKFLLKSFPTDLPLKDEKRFIKHTCPSTPR